MTALARATRDLWPGAAAPGQVQPILAIDPASKLGWAIRRRDGTVESGRLNLPRDTAARLRAFQAFLGSAWSPGTAIAYEEPTLVRFRGRAVNFDGFRVACHLEAVLVLLAGRDKVELRHATPAAVKKAATGKGNAGKAEVLTAMRRRWSYPDLADDNEADALAVLTWADVVLAAAGAAP